jgi:hypothetical protein
MSIQRFQSILMLNVVYSNLIFFFADSTAPLGPGL